MKHARPDYDRFQDPLGLIPADEPVFLLRGQDIAAHVAVRAWANAAQSLGASPEIVRMAVEHAHKMQGWASKVPDVPADPDFREVDEVVDHMTLPIMNGDHAEFEREWAGKDPKTRPDWPYPSFDARDWAEAFCKGFKVSFKDGRPDDGDDMGLMIGWFANALMRGYDHPRPAPATPGLIDGATADEIDREAQKLSILGLRDPLSARTYTALAEILRAEAARMRAA